MKSYWNIGFLILITYSAVFSENIIPDMFPLAVGNYWKFSLKTGGTITYTITETVDDSFVCTQQTSSNGFTYGDTFRFVSYDVLGHFNNPLYRDLSGAIWGPHCALIQKKTIKTDAGIFDETYDYPVTWGHPSGGNRNMIVAPGVGPVAIAYNENICDEPPCLDTFAFIKSYQINKAPEVVWFDNSGTASNDSLFLFSYFKGDSGLVEFEMDQGGCEKYLITSSFNSATGVLRIYMVDTAKVFCNEFVPVRNALKLRNLSEGKTYTIKIYQSYFDESINIITDKIYNLKTNLLYSKKIICEPTLTHVRNLSKKADFSVNRATVYNIQGRMVLNLS
ncbi:MAG TPA: hypothetical protein VHP36_03020, partial [Chitinispirillaceae bacterium]|nr:hypothetical protein [Chitinispirillaceae bacterium]